MYFSYKFTVFGVSQLNLTVDTSTQNNLILKSFGLFAPKFTQHIS